MVDKEVILELIENDSFVLDTQYRQWFKKNFIGVREATVDYECRRMYELGRSIIQNGQTEPITKNDGWHRTQILNALNILIIYEGQ